MQKKYLLTGLTGLVVTGAALYITKGRSTIREEAGKNKIVCGKEMSKSSAKDNAYAYLNDLSVYDDRPE